MLGNHQLLISDFHKRSKGSMAWRHHTAIIRIQIVSYLSAHHCKGLSSDCGHSRMASSASFRFVFWQQYTFPEYPQQNFGWIHVFSATYASLLSQAFLQEATGGSPKVGFQLDVWPVAMKITIQFILLWLSKQRDLQNELHNSPVRARYGVSFIGTGLTLLHAIITSLSHSIDV